MNLSTVNVVMFFGGIVLVYSSIKGEDPRNTMRKALGKAPINYNTGKPMTGPDLSGAPHAEMPPPGTPPSTPPYAWPTVNPSGQKFWV